MNANRIFSAALIIVSLPIFYIGVNKVARSTETINFLGIKIDASNESGQMEGYIYLGIAVVMFLGGVYLFGKARR